MSMMLKTTIKLLRPGGFQTFGPVKRQFLPVSQNTRLRIAQDSGRQLLHVKLGDVDLNHGKHARVDKRRDRFDS